MLDIKLPDNDDIDGLKPIIKILDHLNVPWVIYSVLAEQRHEKVIPKGMLGDLISQIGEWVQAFTPTPTGHVATPK